MESGGVRVRAARVHARLQVITIISARGWNEWARVTELRAVCFGIQRSRAFCRQISRPFHKAFRVLAFSARRRVAGATSCARYDFLLC